MDYTLKAGGSALLLRNTNVFRCLDIKQYLQREGEMTT